MAVSVDWAQTRVIFVPKADLTLVQASPEIRRLDVDAFRLELGDLLASSDGMPFTDTHRHSTEATVAGLTLSRVVEILAPYTVEFEDGQYTVEAIGANHNLASVKVQNQVSLITQNSAGLINLAQLNQVESDIASIATDVGTIQADIATLDGRVATIEADIAQLQTDVRTLLKYARNRLKIDSGTSTLILYDDDGTTPLQTWPLYDRDGNSIIVNVGVQTERGDPV